MEQIVIKTEGHSVSSLQEVIYENEIDYIVTLDDLKWDGLIFILKF